MPQIVGLIKIELPIVRKLEGGVQERIAHIGFDAQGISWGLVSKLVPIPDLPGVARLDFDRWVVFKAIPFVFTETVEAGTHGWLEAPKGKG